MPDEGDVRLVPLNGTAVATTECDEVHFGGVELFHDGRWGRICPGRISDYEATYAFTVDAQAICRQLGFPFSTIMDASDLESAYDRDNEQEDALTWTTDVRIQPGKPHLVEVGGGTSY